MRQLSANIRSLMPEKSALKLTNIFPDFDIHGHQLHGLHFHGHNYSRKGLQRASNVVIIMSDNVGNTLNALDGTLNPQDDKPDPSIILSTLL